MDIRKYAFILIIILFFSDPVFSQDFSVTEIRIPPDTSRFAADDKIIYPILKFRDQKLTAKINEKVFQKFKSLFDLPDSLSDIQMVSSVYGLGGMSYAVLRNDAQFFSFSLEFDYLAVYPVYWKNSFCFNKSTGNLLTIDSLLSSEKQKKFAALVKKANDERVKDYIREMKASLKNHEIDTSDYKFAMESLRYCPSSYDPYEFCLGQDTLEIIAGCGFPHVLEAIAPPGSFYFPIKEMNAFLNRRYFYASALEKK
jgi:hypothetical protein